jgi:hypothetical protein
MIIPGKIVMVEPTNRDIWNLLFSSQMGKAWQKKGML